MKARPRFLALPSLLALATAHGGGEHRRVKHGLIGYGIDMYHPLCAFACREVLSSNRLVCSTSSHSDKAKRHNDSVEFETAADCYASNQPYLISLAGCLHSYCDELAQPWDLDRFWALDAAGSQSPQPDPSMTLPESLKAFEDQDNSHDHLEAVADLHGTLHEISRVSQEAWEVAYSSVSDSVYVEEQHSRHAIILIVSITAIPLAVHLLRLIRLPTFWERRATTVLGHSALFGKRHAVPLPYDIGLLPTRGQAVFISSLLILNCCLLLTGYKVTEPNIYDQTASYRLLSHTANRAGILSFANLILMMLCCGRNNLAVRFTKWSYSTMLLYHRWIAYICILEAFIHATIHFLDHIPYLAHKFTQAYWNIGVVTMSLMCLVVLFSALPVRKRAYEFFVDSHIFLSFLIFLGCYCHIYMKFQHEWGHENWIYLAMFLWVVDRVFRAVKLMRGGVRTAVVTHIDNEYARIDIPGVKASGHAYLYFPGLSWRPWQNHPFSIAASVHDVMSVDDGQLYSSGGNGTAVCEQQQLLLAAGSANMDDEIELKHASSRSSLTSLLALSTDRTSDGVEREKASAQDDARLADVRGTRGTALTPQTTGLVFYVRRQRGITARLFELQQQKVKVLIEAPYRPLPIPNIATCPTLVCIAGGVGISAVLPVARSHGLTGRTVLYWSSRSAAFVDAVDLNGLKRAGVEIHIKIGERWDVHEIVAKEARTAVRRGDVIVVASGPNDMADDVRVAVVKANLRTSHSGRGRVRLVEESFS